MRQGWGHERIDRVRQQRGWGVGGVFTCIRSRNGGRERGKRMT